MLKYWYREAKRENFNFADNITTEGYILHSRNGTDYVFYLRRKSHKSKYHFIRKTDVFRLKQ